jgi:hypothetical protein
MTDGERQSTGTILVRREARACVVQFGALLEAWQSG